MNAVMVSASHMLVSRGISLIDLYGAVVQRSTTPALQAGIPRTGSNPVSSKIPDPKCRDHPGLYTLRLQVARGQRCMLCICVDECANP